MPSSPIDPRTSNRPEARNARHVVQNRWRIASLSLAALLTVACGSTDTTETPYGSPASASEATRVIEIIASDELAFQPSSFAVSVGEIVKFRITNNGQIPHDFTLGDEAAQNRHAEEMANGGHAGHDSPNVVVIAPGTTGEVTWAFTQAGTVLIGCHQPGHYPAGMRGIISVGG